MLVKYILKQLDVLYMTFNVSSIFFLRKSDSIHTTHVEF